MIVVLITGRMQEITQQNNPIARYSVYHVDILTTPVEWHPR